MPAVLRLVQCVNVWVSVCVHGEFPRECDITQCGLLLGVLLLLPATPSPGEHDIVHTNTNSHRGDPHQAQIPPKPPPCQCFCRCIYMCEWCLPGCRPIKSMLSLECLSAGGPCQSANPVPLTAVPPPPRQAGQSHVASHRKGL
ncbi:hypothetical protein AMECASPLE_034615 [Ameca splendens]|uniref:Uncharacterized protein n=1 Tax=Ameca splendens TaxID=208324 RepID=A0ABV1A541_9TELE